MGEPETLELRVLRVRSAMVDCFVGLRGLWSSYSLNYSFTSFNMSSIMFSSDVLVQWVGGCKIAFPETLMFSSK